MAEHKIHWKNIPESVRKIRYEMCVTIDIVFTLNSPNTWNPKAILLCFFSSIEYLATSYNLSKSYIVLKLFCNSLVWESGRCFANQ